MDRHRWVGLAAVGLAVLVGTGGFRAEGVAGDQNRVGRKCSVATLKGSFGIQIQGTRPVTPPAPAGTIESVVGVIVRHYDGQGQFTQVNNEKGSISGSGLADREGFGSYHVNEDCTGSHELTIPGVPFPILDRFVIVDAGKEVRSFVVSPAPLMISAVSKKM